MTEFKIPSHNKRYNRGTANRQIWTVLIVVGVILGLMYVMRRWGMEETIVSTSAIDYTPDVRQGVVYHKPGFSLSYVEEYELPEWIAYELTVDMMNKPKFERDQDFEPDPAIRTGSAHYHDYKGSGYRKGHLVPSADMAGNKASMDATFLMSNIAPMREDFNDGIWLELEHNVRDWSRKHQRIYVVAGPILGSTELMIGDNEVYVPARFFKAVFTVTDSFPKVIGFIIEQETSHYSGLASYAVPIDSIEKETGIDLFSNLYGSWDTEIALEKIVSTADWPFNDRWYNQRMENR
jgi:endonuclease G